MTTSIGVIVGDFDSHVENALRYLIVYQNKLQRSFDFSLLAYPEDDDFLDLLAAKEFNRKTIKPEIKSFSKRVREFNFGLSKDYARRFDRIDAIVVLTAASLADNFYTATEGDCTVIALGGWQEEFFPPSIVEYFLTFLARAALRRAVPDIKSHVNTRGCVFDFNIWIDDARSSVLLGNICPTCRAKVRSRNLKRKLADAEVLFSRSWLGTVASPSDVALTVKKFGYDLFQTAGVKPTWRDRLLLVLEKEGPKNLLKAISTALIAIFLAVLGLKSL